MTVHNKKKKKNHLQIIYWPTNRLCCLALPFGKWNKLKKLKGYQNETDPFWQPFCGSQTNEHHHIHQFAVLESEYSFAM